MMTFKEFLAKEKVVNDLTLVFKNMPYSEQYNILQESLNEGKNKDWGNGYSYRLDKRPDHMGGDQLHIYGRKGQAWAYRENGQKSEPTKYTLSATNVVKDIVSDIFALDRNLIEGITIISVGTNELLVEIKFT